jgi:predicted benzoate:H+ symporter BenE
MSATRNRRSYILVAAIVIGIALLLLSLAHTDAGQVAVLIVLLPIVFIGVLSSLSLLSPMEFLRLGLRSDDPALPTSFQRPPPWLLA